MDNVSDQPPIFVYAKGYKTETESGAWYQMEGVTEDIK